MDGSMARIARLQDEVLQAVFLITARGITLGMKTSRTWREFVRTFCVCVLMKSMWELWPVIRVEPSPSGPISHFAAGCSKMRFSRVMVKGPALTKRSVTSREGGDIESGQVIVLVREIVAGLRSIVIVSVAVTASVAWLATAVARAVPERVSDSSVVETLRMSALDSCGMLVMLGPHRTSTGVKTARDWRE